MMPNSSEATVMQPDDVRLVVPQLLSESLEISYQIMFFIIGTPLNIVAIRRTSNSLSEGGVESRLVKLSRHMMIAHIMVLAVYGCWRSWWIYSFFWTQGDLMCRLFSFATTLPFHLWSNIVAAIAVDMLCCIGSPLSSYRNGATRVRYLIIVCWVAAILCALPMALLKTAYKLSPTDIFVEFKVNISETHQFEYYQCSPATESFPGWVAWNGYMHVFTSFYGPLAIIIACYSAIGVILQKQMTTRRLISEGGGVALAKTSATKARFLRATVAIVCAYALTWLPYQVFHLLTFICPLDSACTKFTANVRFLQAIIIASTCINPFLYNFDSDRKSRRSGNGSTFEAAPRATLVVSLHAKSPSSSLQQSTTEKCAFLQGAQRAAPAAARGTI